MNQLAPIAPKLALVIPRLASDHDGEVVATVNAITRLLSGAGLDWHDLAAAVTALDAPCEEERRPEFDEAAVTWWQVAHWLRDRIHLLRAKEIDFVQNMAGRPINGPPPTEKQQQWLANIYDRVVERE